MPRRTKVKTPSPPRRPEKEVSEPETSEEESEESVDLSDVDSTEESEESESEAEEESEEKESEKSSRKTRERKKAPPVITFESLWNNASKNAPYNPVLAEELLRYLETTNPLTSTDKYKQLQELLKKALKENPKPNDVKLLQSLNGVITLTISENDKKTLQDLLLEILKKDDNFHYRTPITVLLPSEIQHLQNLTYTNSNEKIFAINNRSLVFELICLLLQIGYPATLAYLTNPTFEAGGQNNVLFNSQR